MRPNPAMVRPVAPPISQCLKMMGSIVGMAKAAGWEYSGFIDLTPISFEYAYHLHFKHP
jgi:hypothetical protein